jgi:hypothetical protein
VDFSFVHFSLSAPKKEEKGGMAKKNRETEELKMEELLPMSNLDKVQKLIHQFMEAEFANRENEKKKAARSYDRVPPNKMWQAVTTTPKSSKPLATAAHSLPPSGPVVTMASAAAPMAFPPQPPPSIVVASSLPPSRAPTPVFGLPPLPTSLSSLQQQHDLPHPMDITDDFPLFPNGS